MKAIRNFLNWLVQRVRRENKQNIDFPEIDTSLLPAAAIAAERNGFEPFGYTERS